MTTLVRLSYRQQVICVTQKTHLRCFRKAPQALSRKKGNTVFRADRNGGMPLETNDLMLRLRVLSYSLTGAMQKAAQFYAQTPCSVSVKMSLRRAAQCIGVSESTVVRLARQLGFDGFSSFRNALRESPAKIGARAEPTQNTKAWEICQAAAQANIRAIEASLETLDARALDDAARRLLNAERIVIAAQGASAIAAESMSARLQSLGRLVNCCTDPTDACVHASLMKKQDVLLLFSMSGRTRTALLSARLAKQNGAAAIAVTANADSPAAKCADTILLVSGQTPRANEVSYTTPLFMMTADCIFMAVYALLPQEERQNLTAYRALRKSSLRY